MPQGDFVNFSSTVFAVGLFFLVGYALFVSFWAPKFLLIIKARNWVARFTLGEAAPAQPSRTRRVDVTTFLGATAVVTPTETFAWPELFLMFIQFTLLVAVLSRLTLDPTDTTVLPAALPREVPLAKSEPITVPVENLFFLWSHHRENLFFKSSSSVVVTLVDRVLAGLLQETPRADPVGVLQRLKKVSKGLPHD